MLKSILRNAPKDNLNWCISHNIFPAFFYVDDQKHLQNIFTKNFLANCARNDMLIKQFNCIFQQAQNSNMNMYPIYGIWLLENIYPDSGYRYCEDIDFLIDVSDKDKWVELFKNSGYSYVKSSHGGHRIFQKKIQHTIVRFECHTSLVNTNKNIFNELFPVSNTLLIHLFRSHDLEFQFVILLFHIAKHRFHGVKRYLDIAAFLDRYKEKIDWSVVSYIVEQLHIERSFSLSRTCFFSMLKKGTLPKFIACFEKHLPPVIIYLGMLNSWKARHNVSKRMLYSYWFSYTKNNS